MKKITTLVIAFLSLIQLAGCQSPASSNDTESNSSESSIATSDITYPIVSFNATSPITLETGDQIKIAGNFNNWDPFAHNYALSHVSGSQYTIELSFDESEIGTYIQYKYVLVRAGQIENPWANVEGTATGGETNNRVYKLVAGLSTRNDTILAFKNNINATSVTRGTLTKVTLTMSQYDDNRTRTIRIWTPDDYDPTGNTSYPVLYMHDGQNLFDTYTAFSGEWLIDESIGAMMDLGYGGAIVVGIDNGGGDRINELSPSWPLSSEASEYNIVPSGEKYAAFVVETVKPYVDSHYKTLSDAANTFIGGSSMGGVMSFFMTYTYPEVFGNGLFFSSALWLYESGTVANFINSKGIAGLVNKPKVYIYVGGAESSITAYVSEMYNNLKNNGYTDLEVKTHIEPNKGHNESAWSLEFPKALRWLVDFTG